MSDLRDDPPLELWRDTAGFVWANRSPDAIGAFEDGPVNLSLVGRLTVQIESHVSQPHYYLAGAPQWRGTFAGAQRQLERIVIFMRGGDPAAVEAELEEREREAAEQRTRRVQSWREQVAPRADTEPDPEANP